MLVLYLFLPRHADERAVYNEVFKDFQPHALVYIIPERLYEFRPVRVVKDRLHTADLTGENSVPVKALCPVNELGNTLLRWLPEHFQSLLNRKCLCIFCQCPVGHDYSSFLRALPA